MTAAYTVGLIATALVRRRLGRIDSHRLVRTHLRVLIAATVGTACAGLAVRTLAPVVMSGWIGSLMTVMPAGLAGAAGYLAAGRLLRITELRQIVTATMGGIRAN
jgi:putative peptidoglycan lipid II flippase